MNSLNRYTVALVVLIAFVMGGAVVTSVRQVQATPESAPQVLSAGSSWSNHEPYSLSLDIYYPDKQRIYFWTKDRANPLRCISMKINAPGQPPTPEEKCD